MPVPSDLSKRCGMWLWPTRCGCQAEADAIAQEKELASKAAESVRRREREAMLQRAGLTGLLANCTFDSYQNRKDFLDSSKVLFKAKAYADAVIRGGSERPWLILYGDYGTGKSHLAAAILHATIDAGKTDVFFRDWTRYLQRIRATWNGNEADEYGTASEEAIIRELCRGQVVVIDDLDKNPPTEWAVGVLYSVLNQRYNLSLPTVLTFNHDIFDDVIVKYVGGAILDRMAQHANVVKFKGPSYRTRE